MTKEKSLRQFIIESNRTYIDFLKRISNEKILATFKKVAMTYSHYYHVYIIATPKTLLKGFSVETEHAATVDGNIIKICRIVLDHLSEDPKYYNKLEKIMPDT